MLDPYEIVVKVYLVTDKVYQIRLFEKTFLVANISLDVNFKMYFLTLNNEDIDFWD